MTNGTDEKTEDELPVPEDDIIKTNMAASGGVNLIKDPDHLLQEMDINRLRAVVYR
jgi:hypothetical protein